MTQAVTSLPTFQMAKGAPSSSDYSKAAVTPAFNFESSNSHNFAPKNDSKDATSPERQEYADCSIKLNLRESVEKWQAFCKTLTPSNREQKVSKDHEASHDTLSEAMDSDKVENGGSEQANFGKLEICAIQEPQSLTTKNSSTQQRRKKNPKYKINWSEQEVSLTQCSI